MTELDDAPESRGSAKARARANREALIGATIAGRYVVRGLVGHGGMGAVYEAEHLGLGKRVAIKFIDSEFATDESVVARFGREARVMSAIESAHIVSVFDAGTENGRPYLVMELLRGEDLGHRLRRTRRVPVAEAMHIVAQVLKGLTKAHAAGIIHRDLKPDNVFIVQSDTDPLFAKIVDFGVSKIERPRDKTSPLALTGVGTVLGTPFYMSPEQAQAAAEVDARADLYSVGAILFECLSGRPPHTGETYAEVILSICMRDTPNLRAIDPSISADVASFVERALARDREQRFGSAERMLAALHEVAPAEKTRVPLDPVAPATLLSPGVDLSGATLITAPPAMELAAAMEPRPTPVQPAPAPVVPRQPDPSLTALGLPSRRRSLSTILVTAAIATLMGIAVMTGVISMLGGKDLPPAASASVIRPPPPPAPSATPPASVEPNTDPSAPASATVAVSAVSSARPAPSVRPAAKPAASKLDISRDLP